MKRNWLLAISLALMLIIGGLSGCKPGNSGLGEGLSNLGINWNSQQEGIWVSGLGEVTAVPDIATLRLGIQAQAASVAEAQTQAVEAMNGVMAALTGNGVAEEDIQTQYFSISQVTRWDGEKEEVVGYQVTNMVTAKIRDIDKAGLIIDAVVEAGGDLTRIDSIDFSVDNPSAYYGEAREKAMAEAKAKAEQLARLAGITLGTPTYISEGIQISSPTYRQDIYEQAAPTPISPGEIKISLTVQVTYSILD